MPNSRQWLPTKPRPSGEGRVLFRSVNGQLVVQKWPRKRGKKAHPNSKAWAQYFGAVNKAFPFLHPVEHNGWMNTTVQGRLYPRDLYTAASMGRGFAFEFGERLIIMPARALYDVSRTLDLFTVTPGGLIVNTDEGWRGIEPGLPGQVLTVSETGDSLEWGPGGGGGGAVNKLFTLDPIVEPDTTNAEGDFTYSEDPLGGYVARMIGTSATLQGTELIFSTSYQGGRIVIGVEPWMDTKAENTFAFEVYSATEGYNIGIYLDRLSGGHIALRNAYRTSINSTMGGYSSTRVEANRLWFFAIERIDNAIAFFVGQTPDTMKEFGRQFWMDDPLSFDTVKLSLNTTTQSVLGMGFRLAHCDI